MFLLEQHVMNIDSCYGEIWVAIVTEWVARIITGIFTRIFKAWACGRFLAGIAVSNSAGGMDSLMSVVR
jgi:hypothetical protein